MRKQTLKVTPDKPVFVETVHGVIEIRKVDRSFVLHLPDDLKAWHTADRLVENARFLKIQTPESVRPNYTVLVPRIDDDGQLVGVKMPEPLVVGSRS